MSVVDPRPAWPPEPPAEPPAGFSPLAAADLQDHLMTAANDLERLQRLLQDAAEALMGHFYGANQRMNQLLRQAAGQPALDTTALNDAMQNLGGAVTALQFQDMASQLIVHTHQRLRSCADRLARDVMGDDDEDGSAIVEQPPPRPNPVTQDEMDAGSIELF